MVNKSKHLKQRILPAFIILFLAFFSLVQASADSFDSMLDIGPTVNNKMRFLPSMGNPEPPQQANNIISIRMADSLPDDFVPSERNTVSTADSQFPIYIFFDNNDDAGIMYFFTEGSRIILNPDSSLLFSNFPALKDISGLSDWDTTLVTNMYALFVNAKSLPDALALRNWNTSNVTNMNLMFAGDSSLAYVDVSNWNTSNVTSMIRMFQVGDNNQGNGQLKEILGLGNLDVSNVTDMTCMFYGAGSMVQYDIADWDVSSVVSMNHMFCDNFSLRSLDLSRWDVSNVKTMYCMFDDNYALKTLGDVSHWNTTSLVDIGGWLNYAKAFTGDNFGNMDLSGWDTHNLKAVGEMFLSTRIHTVDLSGWTFESITNDPWDGAGEGIYYEYGNRQSHVKGFGQMFRETPKLTTVFVSQSGLDSFNKATENGVNIEEMWLYSKCSDLTVK